MGNLVDFTQQMRTAHKEYEYSYKSTKSNIYENMQCSNQGAPDSSRIAYLSLAFGYVAS